MENQTNKIINWAASQSNACGAHIDAISWAIDSNDLLMDIIEELKLKRTIWVNEHNGRFNIAA